MSPQHRGPAATAELWSHRDRRIPAVSAASALSGLPTRLLEDAARVSFALSPELEALLDGMEARVRDLPSELAYLPERCVHAVRGPVMWSETITARANSFGDTDVFVCRTVRRSFDCAENRLLVWLLERASSAGRLLRRSTRPSPIRERVEPGELRRVEEIGAQARAWRTGPRLAPIPARVPDRPERTRMRGGRARGEMTSVLLAAWGRARQPFGAHELAALCDEETSRLHEGLLASFLAAGGPEFRYTHGSGSLRCGDVTWRHPLSGPRQRDRRTSQPADS